MRRIETNPVSSLLRTILVAAVTWVTLASGLLVTLFAQEQDWEGERVVNLIEEPRHRPVHIDGNLYLLDVQLNPGDESFPHVHDAAILLTSISNSNGPVGGRVSSNTDYAREDYTHKIYNNGTHQLRILALVNFGAPLPGLVADRPSGLGVVPQLENEWFRSYRIELAPGEATEMQTHHNPTVVAQVTEGLTHVTRVDGITEELNSMADWAWRDAGSPFLVRNVGTEPVAVVINEGRR